MRISLKVSTFASLASRVQRAMQAQLSTMANVDTIVRPFPTSLLSPLLLNARVPALSLVRFDHWKVVKQDQSKPLSGPMVSVPYPRSESWRERNREREEGRGFGTAEARRSLPIAASRGRACDMDCMHIRGQRKGALSLLCL